MNLDEFSEYFERSYEPKILITSSDNPHSKTIAFIKVTFSKIIEFFGLVIKSLAPSFIVFLFRNCRESCQTQNQSGEKDRQSRRWFEIVSKRSTQILVGFDTYMNH